MTTQIEDSGWRRRLSSALGRIHTINAFLSAGLITFLVIMVTANVIMRRFFGGSIRGAIEISEVVLVAAVYLAMGVTQRQGRHISITVATAWLPSRVRRVVTRIGRTMAALFVGIVVWEGSAIAKRATEAGEARYGLLSVPTWPARIVLVVGMLLLLAELLRGLLAALPDDDLVQDRPEIGAL